jgi:hypothetical protein
MEDRDIIQAWKEETEDVLKNRRLPRSQIEALLKPKVRKAALSVDLNIVLYLIVQLAAITLIGLDLYGYRSNPLVLGLLIAMLAMCSSFLGYGVFLLSHIRQISSGSFDLATTISKRLNVYRTHYEVWMWMGAVSCLLLSYALNMLIDNNEGTYRINRPVVFVVTSLLGLLIVYMAQKATQSMTTGRMKAYLEDLHNELLEKSKQVEEGKRRHRIRIAILVIVLTVLLILGIVMAMSV